MKLKEFYKGSRRASAIALIAANMVPVFGALFLGWSVAPLLFLFWTENVILGIMGIVKLLTIKRRGREKPLWEWVGKIFVALFFTVHYGGFCAGHALGVLLLIGITFYIEGADDIPKTLIKDMLFKDKLIYAIGALFVSHLVSLISNWFLKKERYGKDYEDIMKAPYYRVMVLHITIILGAFPMVLLRSPVAGLVLLLGIKTNMDLKAHLGERRRMQPKELGYNRWP